MIDPVMKLFGGTLEAGHDLATASYPLWTLDRVTAIRLGDEGRLMLPKSLPVSPLMFHCNLVHTSPGNNSPWNRTIVYVSACHVNNQICRFRREKWIAH